jgi:hypothetical protein
LTIVGSTIDDCCVWRSGTRQSSIVNEPIVNSWATPKLANTRNLREPKRNQPLVAQALLLAASTLLSRLFFGPSAKRREAWDGSASGNLGAADRNVRATLPAKIVASRKETSL